MQAQVGLVNRFVGFEQVAGLDFQASQVGHEPAAAPQVVDVRVRKTGGGERRIGEEKALNVRQGTQVQGEVGEPVGLVAKLRAGEVGDRGQAAEHDVPGVEHEAFPPGDPALADEGREAAEIHLDVQALENVGRVAEEAPRPVAEELRDGLHVRVGDRREGEIALGQEAEHGVAGVVPGDGRQAHGFHRRLQVGAQAAGGGEQKQRQAGCVLQNFNLSRVNCRASSFKLI